MSDNFQLHLMASWTLDIPLESPDKPLHRWLLETIARYGWQPIAVNVSYEGHFGESYCTANVFLLTPVDFTPPEGFDSFLHYAVQTLHDELRQSEFGCSGPERDRSHDNVFLNVQACRVEVKVVPEGVGRERQPFIADLQLAQPAQRVII